MVTTEADKLTLDQELCMTFIFECVTVYTISRDVEQ